MLGSSYVEDHLLRRKDHLSNMLIGHEIVHFMKIFTYRNKDGGRKQQLRAQARGEVTERRRPRPRELKEKIFYCTNIICKRYM
jgi:hypothetical protein